MTEPVAYTFMGITFCPECALRNSNVGLLLAQIPPQPTMEDVIAAMALAQVERGLAIDTPMATNNPDTDTCDGAGCERKLVSSGA